MDGDSRGGFGSPPPLVLGWQMKFSEEELTPRDEKGREGMGWRLVVRGDDV